MAMPEDVAEAILEAYGDVKIDTPAARRIIVAWATARGWERDRWGHFRPSEGTRIRLAKRVMQRQSKRYGKWSNDSSTPLIQAATTLVGKAAEAVGNTTTLERIRRVQGRRTTARKKQQVKAAAGRRREELEGMALKIVSAEMPEELAESADRDSLSPRLSNAFQRTIGQLEKLRDMDRLPADGDIFSTHMPPFAPLIADVDAVWVEQIRGVAYSVSIEHKERNVAAVEIGGISSGVGMRVDAVTRGMHADGFTQREGDAYISGRIERRRDKPSAAMYFIMSEQKQQGAGSRVLDLWCNLMEAYGIEMWVAEAVGDEGMAFFAAKIRDGRLEEVRRKGSHLLMRCVGGPEARQQRLRFNPTGTP